MNSPEDHLRASLSRVASEIRPSGGWAGSLDDLLSRSRVVRRRSTRPIVIGAAAVALLGVGVPFAVAQLGGVGDKSTVECYSSAVYPGDESDHTLLGMTGQSGAIDIEDAVDACSALWRQGIFRIGIRGISDDQHSEGVEKVPDLVVCVLPDGRAGVFPGGHQTCGTLGLAANSTVR